MRGFTGSLRACIAGMLLLAALLPATAQDDRLARLQTRFTHENDPVRKAKTLSKLQGPQFDLARKSAGAGHADEALRVVEQYRDEVRAVHAALEATGINAEKKPDGFKQLQISLRKSIRELNDLSLSMPMDDRGPFEAIRQELEGIDKQLLHQLFPRHPAHKKPEGQAPGQ